MIVVEIPFEIIHKVKYVIFIILLLTFINIMQLMTKWDMPIQSYISDPSIKELLAKNECFVPTNLNKIDWHDIDFIKKERLRKGLGEGGNPACSSVTDLRIPIAKDYTFRTYGLNSKISDEIDLNRSLPDNRPSECKNKLYIQSLPTVSVIIPFYNEHFNTLLRTLYSIINRSPKELLKEVLLIDDASTIEILKDPLQEHVSKHLPKVRILRAKKKEGLIRAKLFGAKEATADVLVFLEAHIEVNVNWLPPLIEPIALDCHTVTCPAIDSIDYVTFEYTSIDSEHRGGFDWNFQYKILPLLPEDKDHIPDPFATPVMEGSIFAISRVNFWELGGFDPGLYIWGGEQYEMSFKIWQCRGRLLKVPCSRLGHIYRERTYHLSYGYDDFMNKNYHRVAAVWMDDYANYIYYRNPIFSQIKVSDTSEQKAYRQKMQCKSFQWYLTEVASGLLLHFPPIEPPPLAKGQIRIADLEDFCIQADVQTKKVFLNICFYLMYKKNQEFLMTWKDIRTLDGEWCLDLPNARRNSPLFLYKCHDMRGNQEWRYDPNTKQISQRDEFCLGWNEVSRTLYADYCDTNSAHQQWDIDLLKKDT